MVIRIAKQFKENAQTYLEIIAEYNAITIVPPQNRSNESEETIERIVQKALAPIAETLRKIAKEKTSTIENRPNYNNRGQSYPTRGQGYPNRSQNFRNRSNTLSRCFNCGQTGHMAWNCSTRQANPESQTSQTINTQQLATNT